MITGITFIGCYLLYEFVIRRITILRPLFGLNWKVDEKKESNIKVVVDKA
jgi:hypothetical protein